MKMSLVSLGSVLFLAACSGGGSGGNGGGKVDPMGGPVNPAQRPPNPASKAYIKELFKSAGKSEGLIPDGDAIYAELFFGDYVSKVSDESREKAIGRLNEQGRQYLERIKATCLISPSVSKAASGDTENAKEGDVITVKMGLSSSGPGCELLESKNADIKIQYLKKEKNPENTKTVDRTIRDEVETETREIRNAQVINAVGFKSSKTQRVSKSDSEYTFERVSGSPEYKYRQVSRYANAGSSTSESVMANGTVIKSTSQNYSRSERLVDENGVETSKSESSNISKMSTPGGAIWIGYSRVDNEPEAFYVNGQQLTEAERNELFGSR
ncbi:hypothetical protein AZI86_03035 [Bdellovibrio bacteriovorus]|uniref:Lipoprotein n=1 Tax=Bdellovibrio bacteriovorus TaxID=959 RepID=A0A150WNW6_BDEBC|nr:hypothetical protein [Bdellovibrio bacteriovorus]KYG66056.1 hypothetical protein AZI86_03035 [Bdellovibrio bacteriovorus]